MFFSQCDIKVRDHDKQMNFRSTLQFLDIGKSFLKILQYVEQKVYLVQAHSSAFFPGLALHFAWHWEQSGIYQPWPTNSEAQVCLLPNHASSHCGAIQHRARQEPEPAVTDTMGSAAREQSFSGHSSSKYQHCSTRNMFWVLYTKKYGAT